MDKLVISDTSCLIALSNIGMLHILKDLYQEIIITEDVKDEFGDNLPDWIMVSRVINKERQREIENRLDTGEASSIALALEIGNSILIIDEIKGRKIAKSLNLEIIGTIGVLILASKNGLIKDVMSIILKLVNNEFRLSEKLLNRLTDEFGSN